MTEDFQKNTRKLRKSESFVSEDFKKKKKKLIEFLEIFSSPIGCQFAPADMQDSFEVATHQIFALSHFEAHQKCFACETLEILNPRLSALLMRFVLEAAL